MGKERKKTAAWVWPLRGLAVSLITYVAAVALLALLVTRGTVGEDAADVAVGACSALAAFAGGVLSARRGSWAPLPGALAAAGGLAVCMVAVGLTWEEGIGPGAVIPLCGCGVGGVLAAAVGRRPGRRVRGKVHRRKP